MEHSLAEGDSPVEGNSPAEVHNPAEEDGSLEGDISAEGEQEHWPYSDQREGESNQSVNVYSHRVYNCPLPSDKNSVKIIQQESIKMKNDVCNDFPDDLNNDITIPAQV